MPVAPQAFKPAGRVVRALMSATPPPFLRQKRYTGRRAEGIRYEKKVHQYLKDTYGEAYTPSPWLQFFSENEEKWRWCQPDGVIVLGSVVTIVEVKYQHTSDAWWQVRQLYQPVLQKVLVDAATQINVCEIVKWYDPAVIFPEETVLTNDVTRETSKFKVHIWRP